MRFSANNAFPIFFICCTVVNFGLVLLLTARLSLSRSGWLRKRFARMFLFINVYFHLPVPPEIQARGIEAKHAFQRALKKGKVRVYRGSVMLIGQNRAGKTSLKKSLLGLKFDPGEESTEGIEVDPSRFDLDVDRVMNWQLVKNEKFTSEFADDIARLVVGELRSGDEEKKPEVNSSEVEPVQTDVTQGASAPQSDQV